MKKIISLFQRNYDGDRLVRDEVAPGAEWVIAGEGIATRKWDGSCCMVRDGKLYKRYDAKKGRTPPPGWEQAQDPDPVSGHWPGWLVVGDGSEDRWFRAALQTNLDWQIGNEKKMPDGTYEACGPHFQGNPDQRQVDALIAHGKHILADAPRTFNELKKWFATQDIEGIVWHHPDGRMVKIKKKDFGFKR